MKTPYFVGVEDGCILVSFEPGSQVGSDLLMRAIREESDLQDERVRNDLWDFRGCLPSDDLSFDVISRLVDYIWNRREGGWSPRTAFVVDEDVTYGLSRMYQTLVNGHPTEVEIFRDEEEAREWLGLTAKHIA